MIIDSQAKGFEDDANGFFKKNAQLLLTTFILHSFSYFKDKTPTILDVKHLISGTGLKYQQVLNGISRFKHVDPYIDAEIKRSCSIFLGQDLKTLSGVYGSMTENLTLYGDPIIASNLNGSDFKIDDLINGSSPTSLYFIIPPEEIIRLSPLVRLFFNLVLAKTLQNLKKTDGRMVASSKHRLLLLLNEFTAFGKIGIFEKSIGYLRGYGVKAMVIIQDLSQLYQVYGENEGISGNYSVKVAFAPAKVKTAEELSKFLGKSTVVKTNRSRSTKFGSMFSNTSENISEVGVSLLAPDELIRLKAMEKHENGDFKKPGEMLIIPSGSPPVIGVQHPYFLDDEFLRRSRLSPVVHNISEEDQVKAPQISKFLGNNNPKERQNT